VDIATARSWQRGRPKIPVAELAKSFGLHNPKAELAEKNIGDHPTFEDLDDFRNINDGVAK